MKQRTLPPKGHFAKKPGTKTKVKHVFGGYMLPDGLKEGDEVTILSWDIGRYQVEKDGKQYSISCVNVVG
jgi:hypothetical protein